MNLPGTPPDSVTPPGPPPDGTAPSGQDVVHAISRLYLGETDAQGKPDSSAWKKIGFDIDGWNSTPKQGFHCKPQLGAKLSSIAVDGEHGIDNSFGQYFVGAILTALMDVPSGQASGAIAEGEATSVLKFEKMGPTSTTSNLVGIRTQFFPSIGALDPVNPGKTLPPGGDWSSYQWRPLADELNVDGSAKVQFPASYVSKGLWVSGSKTTVVFPLILQGVRLRLVIQQAQLVVDLSNPKAGTNGTIGGILATEQLVSALQGLAANLSSQFCDPNSPALASILDSIRQSSDIMLDGTQDPTKECNGISIGLGFDTKVTALGEVAPPAQTTSPCPQ